MVSYEHVQSPSDASQYDVAEESIDRTWRSIEGFLYNEHCKPLFRKLGILTVPSLFIFECLLLVKNNIQNFTRHNDVHEHNTRNKTNLSIPQLRLNKSQNGPRTSIQAMSGINSLVEPGKPFHHFWRSVLFPEEYKNRTLIGVVWTARRDLLQSVKLLKRMSQDQLPIEGVNDTMFVYKHLLHGSVVIGNILLTELLAKVTVSAQLATNAASSNLQEMASEWSEQNLNAPSPSPSPPPRRRRRRRRRRVVPPIAVAVPAGDGPEIGPALLDQQDLGPVQLDQPSIRREEHLIPDELPSTSAVLPPDFGDDEESRGMFDEIANALREFTLVQQVTTTSQEQPPLIELPTSSAAVPEQPVLDVEQPVLDVEQPVLDVEQPVQEVATPRRRHRPSGRPHPFDHFVPRTRPIRSLPFVDRFIFNYEDAIGALADDQPPERLLRHHRNRLIHDRPPALPQPDAARLSESSFAPPAAALEPPSVAEPAPGVPDIEPAIDIAEIQPEVAPEQPSVAGPIDSVPDIEPPVPEIQENEFGSAQQLIDIWAREYDGTGLGSHENGLIKHLLQKLDEWWRNKTDPIPMSVLCPKETTRRSVSARAFNIVIHFWTWKIVDIDTTTGQQFEIANIKPGRKVVHIYQDIVF